jgi:hypothetical protein
VIDFDADTYAAAYRDWLLTPESRHYGPGNHPDGSSQKVHAGKDEPDQKPIPEGRRKELDAVADWLLTAEAGWKREADHLTPLSQLPAVAPDGVDAMVVQGDRQSPRFVADEEDVAAMVGAGITPDVYAPQFVDVALGFANRIVLYFAGHVAGAYGFNHSGADEFIPFDYAGSGYFGSMGIADHTGSVLWASFIRYAAAMGEGAVVYPVPEARPFWQKMFGITLTPGEPSGGLRMPPEEVAYLAGKLGDGPLNLEVVPPGAQPRAFTAVAETEQGVGAVGGQWDPDAAPNKEWFQRWLTGGAARAITWDPKDHPRDEHNQKFVDKPDTELKKPEEVAAEKAAGINFIDANLLIDLHRKAIEKYHADPPPTAEEIAKAIADYERLGAADAEMVGRGNSTDRRHRKLRMARDWGDGERAPCVYCGAWLPIDRIEADRIYPGRAGGSYRYENVIPADRVCNARRGARDFSDFENGWSRVTMGVAAPLAERTVPGGARALPPDGTVCRGIEACGPDRDFEPRSVEGPLESRYVPVLDFWQAMIDGAVIDPGSLTVA